MHTNNVLDGVIPFLKDNELASQRGAPLGAMHVPLITCPPESARERSGTNQEGMH